VQVRRVYRVKVKPHKLALIALEATVSRKALMLVSLKVKILVLEIQTLIPHAASDAGSNTVSRI